MNGNPNVYYVGGSKGGVGKSLFSFVLTDCLLNQEKNVLLVDTDTDNPDVYKAHKDLALPNLRCEMNALDDADGWADLLDTVQTCPDTPLWSMPPPEPRPARPVMATSCVERCGTWAGSWSYSG